MAELTPTLVRANSTIGANATLLCGITIGHGAFIGAGAVVARSILGYALVLGNPARQVGWMCVCAKKLRLPASAPLESRATCSHCGRSFVRTPGGLSDGNLAPGKELL